MQNYSYPKKNNKKKDPRFDWRTIFLKDSGGLSSKRILSILGFITCVIIFIVSFITQKDVPEFGEVIFIGCISLYGIDTVPNFWQKSINKS